MSTQLKTPGVYVDSDYPENAASKAALEQMSQPIVTPDRVTFLEACQKGSATAADLDDYIDVWHSQACEEPSLKGFLGLSDAQYASWLTGATTIEAIISAHLSVPPSEPR